MCGNTESDGNPEERPIKEIQMVSACDEKRGGLCRKEPGGHGIKIAKEEENVDSVRLRADLWRRDCRISCRTRREVNNGGWRTERNERKGQNEWWHRRKTI